MHELLQLWYIRVRLLACFVFFPSGVLRLQSDWSPSCGHRLDYASWCENNNNNSNSNNNSNINNNNNNDDNNNNNNNNYGPT